MGQPLAVRRIEKNPLREGVFSMNLSRLILYKIALLSRLLESFEGARQAKDLVRLWVGKKFKLVIRHRYYIYSSQRNLIKNLTGIVPLSENSYFPPGVPSYINIDAFCHSITFLISAIPRKFADSCCLNQSPYQVSRGGENSDSSIRNRGSPEG